MRARLYTVHNRAGLYFWGVGAWRSLELPAADVVLALALVWAIAASMVW